MKWWICFTFEFAQIGITSCLFQLPHLTCSLSYTCYTSGFMMKMLLSQLMILLPHLDEFRENWFYWSFCRINRRKREVCFLYDTGSPMKFLTFFWGFTFLAGKINYSLSCLHISVTSPTLLFILLHVFEHCCIYSAQSSMGKKDAEIFRPRQYNNFNRQYLMEGNVEFFRVCTAVMFEGMALVVPSSCVLVV